LCMTGLRVRVGRKWMLQRKGLWGMFAGRRMTRLLILV
jgi:hypothetical protein